MSFFSVNGLCVDYGNVHVLDDISFAITEGTLVGILGANGSGKTTLLKAVCGILPHEGNCVLDGTMLEGLSPRNIAKLCSYIPQRSGITIDISVIDVVLMGFNPQLGLLARPNAGMRKAAVHALALVGLAGREDENYLHLSEGQKQLCILARTLVFITASRNHESGSEETASPVIRKPLSMRRSRRSGNFVSRTATPE